MTLHTISDKKRIRELINRFAQIVLNMDSPLSEHAKELSQIINQHYQFHNANSMKVENQVCTLEQAIKLKSLGIIQNSQFVHGLWHDGDDFHNVIRYGRPKEHKKSQYAAFNVAELGVMLPNALHNPEDQYRPFVEFYPHTNRDMWKFNDPYAKYSSSKIVTEATTEAEARAAMLIYLLENNYVTAQEVNERLQNA